MSRLVLAVCLGCAAISVAQDTPADLAIKARAILSKHCGECHGEKPQRSSMSVMHHSRLTRNDGVVRFVSPKDVKASQLLDLIDEGSMPPGNRTKVSADDLNILRQWVQTGAPGYPAQFDDDFAHRSILSDIERRPAVDRPFMRYFSIHHLYESDPADFAKARKKVLDGLQRLFRDKSPLPEPIEDTASLFRIDLRTSGWQHRVFRILDSSYQPRGPSHSLSIFDLVLLEYPFLTTQRTTPSFQLLAEKFLFPAQVEGQVLPVSFIRGDWFVDIVGEKWLARDLQLAFQAARERVPGGISSARSANSDLLVRLGNFPTLDSGSIFDPKAAKPVPGLTISTSPVDSLQRQASFYFGDNFKFRYGADSQVFGQYVFIDSERRIRDLSTVKKVPVGKNFVETLPRDGPLRDDSGPYQIRLLVSLTEFERGEAIGLVHNGDRVDRVIHPFFRVALNKSNRQYEVDESAIDINRRTLQISVVSPSKATPKK